MTAYFVTGTDTDVGKTVVGTALLAAVTRRGQRAFGFKVAESGCERSADGSLVPRDATRLARAGRHEVACPFRYQKPLAPAVAAMEEKVSEPVLSTIIEDFRAGSASADLAIAEGAGGLLVPIASDLLVADIVLALELPLLIVARDGLGTINHTALTIEAAARRNLHVHAFVFSATGDVLEARMTSNAREIEKLTGVRFAGCLRRLTDLDALDSLADAAEADLDLLACPE